MPTSRRLQDLAVGMGPTGDVPYDQSGGGGLLDDLQASSQGGQAQIPVQPDAIGQDRMGSDSLSDQDLMALQQGSSGEEEDPNNIIGDQLSDAYSQGGLDPQIQAQLEEQQRQAALKLLGLA